VGPQLRATFADKDGVHLIWQPAARPEAGAEVEFTCRLDSEVADKLQDCYGQLAKLGYKVAGLELLRERAVRVGATPGKSGDGILPPAHDETRRDAASMLPDPTPSEPASSLPDPTSLKPSEPRAARAPREKRPTVALEVSVGPAKEAGKGAVLVAPDPLLLRTLRAGADPAQPAEERLTFLRGTLGKNGLKIVEVGLGEGKDHAPARWEDAAKWLERQAEKNAVPEAKVVEPSP